MGLTGIHLLVVVLVPLVLLATAAATIHLAASKATAADVCGGGRPARPRR